MQNVITNSDIETMAAGEAFSKALKAGDVVALYGELGAGKTVFVKGIARGLGIADPVTSPTFTILKEYEGRAPLYHFDAYRIRAAEEMDDIGFFDYLGGEGIAVIEWAGKVEALLPEGAIRVVIERTGEDDKRKISIQGGSGEA